MEPTRRSGLIPGEPTRREPASPAAPRRRRRLYEAVEAEGDAVVAPGVRLPAPAAAPRRAAAAGGIIKRYVAWSAGSAVLPIPVIELIAVSAIQCAMVKALSGLYGVDYLEQRARAVVVALIGGTYSGLLANSLGRLTIRLGLLGAVVPLAVANCAICYAVGKVFVQHFEAGGTLLDFDPQKAKGYYARQYEQGRREAAWIRGLGGE